jgi:mRNA interferase MazF
MVEKKAPYIPTRGDVVWMNFSPQAGHEQAGRRPALVLSPKNYNQATGRFIVCPITSQVKGYPFEHALPADCPVRGVILVDHVKNQDWKERNAEFAATVDREVIDPICDMIESLIRPD